MSSGGWNDGEFAVLSDKWFVAEPESEDEWIRKRARVRAIEVEGLRRALGEAEADVRKLRAAVRGLAPDHLVLSETMDPGEDDEVEEGSGES